MPSSEPDPKPLSGVPWFGGFGGIVFGIAVICAAGLLFYMPSMGSRFLYDDIDLIVLNTNIRDLNNLPELLKSGRPVRAVTFLIDYKIWEYNPMGYHLTNMLLHFCASSMLFIFIRSFFKNPYSALGAGLLFVVHPAGSEAVVAVSHRKEMLALIFMVASLYAYSKASMPHKWKLDDSGHARPRWIPYGISFVAYLLALGSKQVAIVTPVLMVMMDTVGTGRPVMDVLRKRWYLYSSLLVVPVLFALISMGDWRVFGVFPPEGFFSVAYLESLGVSAWAVARYVRVMVFPVGLNVDHAVPGLNAGGILIGILMMGGMIWGAWKLKGRALWAFGLGWIPVNLLPVLNIIPANELFSERYLYIPLAGFCMILSSAFSEMSQSKKASGILKGFVLFWIVGLVTLGWQLFLTRHIDMTWLYPVSVIAGFGLLWGSIWVVNRINMGSFKKFITRALVTTILLLAILRFVPGMLVSSSDQLSVPQGYWGLLDYFEKRHWGEDGFKSDYSDKLMRPGDRNAVIVIVILGLIIAGITGVGDSSARLRYATAILLMALIFGTGTYKRVKEWRTNKSLWSATHRANPKSVKSLVNLGISARRHNDYNGAMWAYGKAAGIEPNNALLHYNLALAYHRLGWTDRAKAAFKKTIELNPGNLAARLNLGNIYNKKGNASAAIMQYNQVVMKDPKNAKAWLNLAIVHKELGDMGKFRIACNKALTVKPDFERALQICTPGASPVGPLR